MTTHFMPTEFQRHMSTSEEVGHGHVCNYGVTWILHGAACTKIVWSSFEEVLLSIHKKRILLESACEALLGKRVALFNVTLDSYGATVLRLFSCRQGWSTYVA